MYCLNCGHEGQGYLCENCRTQDILEKLVLDILYYKEDSCENTHLRAYMNQFEDVRAGRDCVPALLELFDEKTVAYIRCRYYGIIKHTEFEELAVAYLAEHTAWDWRRQRILHDLLSFYARNDFVKPRKWCELIGNTAGLSVELYQRAAEFYSYVADYDLAEEMAKKVLSCAEDDLVLFTKSEKLKEIYEKLMTDIERYRTKKPYWPVKEARRRNLAIILDEKGIDHPGG